MRKRRFLSLRAGLRIESFLSSPTSNPSVELHVSSLSNKRFQLIEVEFIHDSAFLLSSQLSRRTRAEILATKAKMFLEVYAFLWERKQYLSTYFTNSLTFHLLYLGVIVSSSNVMCLVLVLLSLLRLRATKYKSNAVALNFLSLFN